jgi:predicted RNA-binding Zn-ribbon protein involved in translation (DUF1610 family)
MQGKKELPSSTSETAFSCPHCGAHAMQFWYKLTASRMGSKTRCPEFVDESELDEEIRKKWFSSTMKRTLKYMDGRLIISS